MGKATGRGLRRYPAKNRGESTVVRRVGKFAKAKCSPSSTSNIRKCRGKALTGTVRKVGYVACCVVRCQVPHGATTVSRVLRKEVSIPGRLVNRNEEKIRTQSLKSLTGLE
jgi:hypothetical protein